MKISRLRKKLAGLYPGVEAEEKDGCVRLTGELDKWEDVVNAGYLAVDKKRYIGVLNDITLKNAKEEKMRLPFICDNKLDGLKPDFLVIGGGISGASILRELMRYDVSAMLVEKESDLAMQASGRNDGEIHPGVDLGIGTKKQYYVVRANRIFGDICDELGVHFERRGQYACFNKPIKPLLRLIAKSRSKIGCPTEVAGKEEILKTEPKFNPEVECAVSNPQSGVVSPYELTIAFAENAVKNGARVELDTAVLSMELKDDKVVSVKTNRGMIYPKVLINAAGTFADKIAEMADDRYFTIHPRSGSDYIFDKKIGQEINHITSIEFISHNKKTAHSKGGGVIKTIENNILIGPNAYETPERENFATESQSLDQVFQKQKYIVPTLEKRDIIAYFTGTRAATYEEDFYIEKGRKTRNIVHCAGIQSPGLTTSPLVAKDVAKMGIDILKESREVRSNTKFDPKRKPDPVLRFMTEEEKTALIKRNPAYGRIVCRCEGISEGEIIDCLNRNIKVPTVNGIKRRARPGMGRCQGGFCMPLVAKIISEHEHIPLEEVAGKEIGSPVVFKSQKGGSVHE